ncbi:hypothetical protein [Microbacterium kunmingense]|uniref:hypothetical protein n=1 Tax=Microbacterium kunmingense TaxID=2915939 RepID=UPI0020061A9F|nr:hypothetical protein [Microbacterium kunmingense]
MRSQGPRHAGPRPHTSWWRGPWPPSVLLLAMVPLLIWELTWSLPLLTGGR